MFTCVFLLNIVLFSVCLTSNELYWTDDQLADLSTRFYTSASWRRRVGPSASWLVTYQNKPVSTRIWQIHLIQLVKTWFFFFWLVLCQANNILCVLKACNLFYHVYLFLPNIDKMRGCILKFRASAIITLRKVIIARYDTILNQSEWTHLCNHHSNYTNKVNKYYDE